MYVNICNIAAILHSLFMYSYKIKKMCYNIYSTISMHFYLSYSKYFAIDPSRVKIPIGTGHIEIRGYKRKQYTFLTECSIVLNNLLHSDGLNLWHNLGALSVALQSF